MTSALYVSIFPFAIWLCLLEQYSIFEKYTRQIEQCKISWNSFMKREVILALVYLIASLWSGYSDEKAIHPNALLTRQPP